MSGDAVDFLQQNETNLLSLKSFAHSNRNHKHKLMLLMTESYNVDQYSDFRLKKAESIFRFRISSLLISLFLGLKTVLPSQNPKFICRALAVATMESFLMMYFTALYLSNVVDGIHTSTHKHPYTRTFTLRLVLFGLSFV